MSNIEPSKESTTAAGETRDSEPRKQRFTHWLRRVERFLEYVALIVHLYIIGEATQHVLSGIA